MELLEPVADVLLVPLMSLWLLVPLWLGCAPLWSLGLDCVD
jgi:hypothetical protein